MKELKARYVRMKANAIDLMKTGNVNAYLATLQEVNDLKMQMIQVSAHN